MFGKKQERDEFDRQADLSREQADYEANMSDGMAEQYGMQTMFSPDLTRWQQDNDPYIQDMICELKRATKNENGEYFIDKSMPPLCSDECIKNLVAQMKGLTSPNTMLSRFEEYKIYQIQQSVEKTIILDVLLPERKKYHTPLGHMSQVKKIFRSFSLPTLFRAHKGFESHNQRAIRTVKELSSSRDESKSETKSWFGG